MTGLYINKNRLGLKLSDLILIKKLHKENNKNYPKMLAFHAFLYQLSEL